MKSNDEVMNDIEKAFKVVQPNLIAQAARERYKDRHGHYPNSGMIRKPIVAKVKVGRNAPCPCGSGKKYKKCCLK